MILKILLIFILTFQIYSIEIASLRFPQTSQHLQEYNISLAYEYYIQISKRGPNGILVHLFV